MKKLITPLIFFLLLASIKTNATHYAGAEIFYEHVAGTLRDYHVTLIVYGDLNGAATLPTTEDISYSSSCNAGGIVNNIQNTQGAQPGYNRNLYIYDEAYPCAPYDPNDPNSVQFYSLTFEATITLPANCNDWKFSWSGFARNNAITNIQNPGGEALYVEAFLNNNLGQNSSPRFTSAPVKQFCVKQPNDPPFPLVQTATEGDGDSIFYELAQPQGAGGALIPWVNGYSTPNPILSWVSPIIDQKTATFFFSPNNPEVDVLKIVVKEYRFDTAGLGQWIFVGSTARDLQIPILTNCNSVAEKGPAIDTTLLGFSSSLISSSTLENVYGINQVSNDSILNSTTGGYDFIAPAIEYNCFDDIITLTFNEAPLIYTPSISNIKDEFRVIGPDGVSRPILDITFNPHPGSVVQTNELYLKLYRPLDADGQYILQIKRGTDGNTIQDECGFQLPPNQIMLINVQNCPALDYSLDHLTVENDKDRRIEWSITDPSYLQPGLFNYWQIGMTVGGATYVRTLNDINARSFTDTEEFFPDHVDHQNFEYWVQLVQNADFKAPAENTLITVRLREDRTVTGPRSSIVHFGWNAYNGFDVDSNQTVYQMYKRECNPLDSTFTSNWELYKGQNSKYFFQDYNINNSNTSEAGLFAFKVEATDNTNPPPAGWISESNWLYVLVEYIPPVDTTLVTLQAPNVFTPNDDSQNDRFYITGVNGGREYSDVQLSVFNRWGQLVYEDNNFAARNNAQQGWDGTSIYTGEKLADGVYYYTVKFKDASTGVVEDLQGSVTLLAATGTK